MAQQINKHTQLVDFSNPNADKIKSATTTSTMAQQTAVRFLFEKMKNFNSDSRLSDIHKELFELFKTAAKMEKQQITEAVRSANMTDFWCIYDTCENYYDKNYS